MPPGGITQLVECLLCKQDVAGPNPTTSTTCGISPKRSISSIFLIFENWQLEIKENYNVYRDYEVGVKVF